MIPEPAVPAVTRDDAQLRAVAFAALAGGCILAMPIHLMLGGAAQGSSSAATFGLVFLVAFVAGTGLLFRFRDVPNAAVIAAAVCVVAAAVVGGANLDFLILRIVVAALVAAGSIGLAFRDWRRPLHTEIVWGALAIGAEAVLARVADLDAWLIPLSVLIPVFFASSLGSRAVTIWHEPEADPSDARAWMDRVPRGFAAYVAAVLGLAAAALQGGVFQWLGSIVEPIASAILTVVLLLLEVVFSPIVWLISRLHVNTDAWERLLRDLGGGPSSSAPLRRAHGALGGTIFRIVGFALFSVCVWVAYRALRTVRAPRVSTSTRTQRAPVASTPIPDEVPPTPRRPSLPADQVRRWYADALLSLDRRQIRKDPSLTPAEFAREVGRTLPELRDHLDALTHAYEDVRYGRLELADPLIRELRGHHRALIAALRNPPGRGDAATT